MGSTPTSGTILRERRMVPPSIASWRRRADWIRINNRTAAILGCERGESQINTINAGACDVWHLAHARGGAELHNAPALPCEIIESP